MKKYQYRKAPNPTEFSIVTGIGKQILDLKTVAKDIPCQNACPAKTNVPKYIEHIFHGNHDAAYRVNLEDNVFPGVLGRICTRPCEDACRHNWTGIEGPVQICHLKRVGADENLKKPEPLSKWFENTGKKVAIIGGGHWPRFLPRTKMGKVFTQKLPCFYCNWHWCYCFTRASPGDA